jgi:hypothetical protein
MPIPTSKKGKPLLKILEIYYFTEKSNNKTVKQQCVFDSVVTGAFQIIFCAKMHANDFFYFLKIIFDISTSKRSKTYKPYLILIKKKIFKIFKNTTADTFPNIVK